MSDRGRLDRAQAVLRERGLTALLAGPSADLFWLTGYRALPLERLTLLIVPAVGEPVMIVPELERPRAAASPAVGLVSLVAWSEGEDPIATAAAHLPADGTFAVQERLWSVFLLGLLSAMPGASWVPAGPVSRELRVRKDHAEVAALRSAGAAIDAVHARVPGWLRPGRTEREVGRDIADAIVEEHDEVNFVIVASGPNGASPHHETGDRVLGPGDAIVIDIGGTRDGYCSDATRNYVLGSPPAGYRELHDVLEAAQRAGVERAGPGVPAEAVDAACRDVIAGAGYGENFIHRTGHGIGVEEHEEPYLVEGNDAALERGMTFSIEPGIYIPGRYGARIEDIVVVTAEGADRLNRRPRELVEVPV